MLDGKVEPFLAAIDRLYAAALAPSQWRGFLAAAATLFSADNGFLCQVRHNGALDGVVLSDRAWGVQARRRYFASIGETPYLSGLCDNPWQPVHCRMAGGALHGSGVYTEALEPLGIEYSLAIGAPDRPAAVNFIGFTRGPGGRPFTAADCAILAKLAPHLQRALAIRAAFAKRTAPRPLDRPIDEAVLNRLFGLSPMQARLTALLRSGCRLKDAAVALGVTEGSARQYLKTIFSKTGARRQIDMIRIVDTALSDDTDASTGTRGSARRILDDRALPFPHPPDAIQSV